VQAPEKSIEDIMYEEINTFTYQEYKEFLDRFKRKGRAEPEARTTSSSYIGN
jgi:hypothetical protein